ncbi:MAG TPA: ABC transporter permease [Micromonosporaceae bacterium]|nr:ABC transporter permease [Micromonosporaceae bacterium]
MRVVHAEWTKLRTVPSTGWLVLAAVAFTVALGSMLAASVTTEHCPAPTACPDDLPKVSLFGVRFGQVAVVALAVLAITNEYATRMIQMTLTVNPRRWLVLATKTAVVTVAALAAGVVAVAGSLLAGRSILPGNGFTAANGYQLLSLADEPTRRAAIGTVLYLGLIALLSLGVGAIVRDTAGAITVVLSLLFLFPMIAMFVTDAKWHERLEKYAPMTAGLNIQATRGLDQLATGPWAGLGVLAAYAGAAVIGGLLVFQFRDA